MNESGAESVDLTSLKIDRKKRVKPPGRWKKWFHLLWILIPIAAFLAYRYTLTEVTPASKVRTAHAQLVTGSEATAQLVATGYVVAQIKAAVASKATGRLKILNVEEGDQVLREDILAQLENDDIKANLELARANLKAVQAESTVAALNYFRQKKLLESGSSTEDVVEAATGNYYRAAANVEAMRAATKVVEVEFDNTYIRAPFDGTVLRKHADIGEMVAPFASSSSSRGAVVTLADMHSLEVEADVSESNIHKVVLNRPCEIILDAYPAHKYPGYVKKIVPTANRSRATVLTKIAFTKIDDRVLPEMSARVNFLPEVAAKSDQVEKPVVGVPKNAITMRNGRKIVFKVLNGYVREVPVEIGRELGSVTEILSGIKEGDEVVVAPPGGMNSGDKVEESR